MRLGGERGQQLGYRFLGGSAGAILACIVWVGTAVAGPATYYASPTSNDTTGSCSSSTPCELDHAISLAGAGDVVVVLPGTYSITYPLETSLPITIEGEPGMARPSLIGSASLTTDTLDVSGGAVVRDLEIETQNNTGARTAALSIDGGTAEDLMLLAGSSDNDGEALSVNDSAIGTVVRTVLARAQGVNSEAVSFTDSRLAPGTASVYNLTAIGESSTATAISGNVATGTVSVKDSIEYGQEEDISTKPGTQPIHVSYSDFRPADSSGYLDMGGNISAAPVFVSPFGGDFHEAASSPTVDAGADDPALTATDLDGRPRILGAASDMGAYEYPGMAVLPPVSSPVAGVSVALHWVSGSVLVKLPDRWRFLRLSRAASVPVGSVIDVTSGRVRLTSAVNRAGATKAGSFHGGRFVVMQPPGAWPTTNLRLVGGSFAGCSRFGSSSDRGAPRARIASWWWRFPWRWVIRQLWGSDNGGRFVTIGNSASAAVRGTIWLTQDLCGGTLIRVLRGRVVVHDDRLGRDVAIGAGHSYLARARP